MVEEIIETFLLILLTLIYKKSILEQEPSIACNIELLGLKKVITAKYTSYLMLASNYVLMYLLEQGHNNTNSVADFKRRPLCAGFYHVVLIRNGNVYTWGSSVQGCLGKHLTCHVMYPFFYFYIVNFCF